MISIYNSNSLKGIAIVMIILCHIVGVFGVRYATPLGGIGVSIFLFISGYGLNESYKKNGLNNFISKRVKKVLIPYWIIVIIDEFINRNSISVLLKEVVLLKTPNFMWFIQYIVTLYLLFYLINKFIEGYLKYGIWCLIGIVIFIFGNSLWAEQAFIFFLGIVYSNENVKLANVKNKFKIGLMLLIIGIIALVLKQTSFIREANVYIYNLVELIIKNCSCLGIIIIYDYLYKNMLKLNRGLNIIGTYSYELYLVHAIAFFILKNAVGVEALIKFVFITILGAVMLKKIVIIIEKSMTIKSMEVEHEKA
ncbi:acyltransferase [Clostridium perfringens]|uniref:acyltransferase n=1 Tax=Clostridium perfringens TaxID=1502 RepID=UPI0032DBE42E